MRNGVYDMYNVLYLLGDKDGWDVEKLVPILLEMNNTPALKELLIFCELFTFDSIV